MAYWNEKKYIRPLLSDMTGSIFIALRSLPVLLLPGSNTSCTHLTLLLHTQKFVWQARYRVRCSLCHSYSLKEGICIASVLDPLIEKLEVLTTGFLKDSSVRLYSSINPVSCVYKINSLLVRITCMTYRASTGLQKNNAMLIKLPISVKPAIQLPSFSWNR